MSDWTDWDCQSGQPESEAFDVSVKAIKNGGTSRSAAVAARPRTQEPDPSRYSGRVAARIEARRAELGLSIKDLAKKLTDGGYTVAPPTLYNWLGGNREPALDALPLLAKVLKVKLHDLLPPK